MATVPDPLLRIPHLFHFTDMVNMPKIKELEGIYSTAKMREMGENFSWPPTSVIFRRMEAIVV